MKTGNGNDYFLSPLILHPSTFILSQTKLRRPHPQDPVAENPGPQTAPSPQESLGPGRTNLVHPIARPTFLDALETHPLHLEFPTDQSAQINALGHHIAPIDRRLPFQMEFRQQLRMNFPGEKGDLSFGILAKIQETVPDHAPTGQALEPFLRDHRVRKGPATVASDKIMVGRAVEVEETGLATHVPPHCPAIPAKAKRHHRTAEVNPDRTTEK